MQKEDYHNTNTKISLLDSYDELTKQLGQARGILSAISCEDQFKTISSDALANTLWAISDNVDKALFSANQMMKSDDVQVNK